MSIFHVRSVLTVSWRFHSHDLSNAMQYSCLLPFPMFLQTCWSIGCFIRFCLGVRRMGEKHAGSILAQLALVLMNFFITSEADQTFTSIRSGRRRLRCLHFDRREAWPEGRVKLSPDCVRSREPRRSFLSEQRSHGFRLGVWNGVKFASI